MIGYGLGYLNQLFLGHTQLTDQRLGTYLQADPPHVPLCLFYGPLMVHKKPLAVFLSNEYIFVYRQIRYEIKFLVNHADTGVQSLLRRHRRQFPAVQPDVPAFPSVCPGKHLKLRIFQYRNTKKTFVNPAHPQYTSVHGQAPLPF